MSRYSYWASKEKILNAMSEGKTLRYIPSSFDNKTGQNTALGIEGVGFIRHTTFLKLRDAGIIVKNEATREWELSK